MNITQTYRAALIAIAGFLLTTMLQTRAIAQTKALKRLEILSFFTAPGPMDQVGPK
jgi:hypothetical protein